jgi:hypothetical protein
MWMNESEIDEALVLVGKYAPRFLPYAKYLSDWRDIINQNSDGWAYWSAGTRPAGKLQELLSAIISNIRGRNVPEPSVKELDRALVPIKSIATRKKLPVPVLGGEVETSEDVIKDDMEFVVWVEETLVPDLKASGTVETAADFERLIRIIRNLSR